jgi:hypothetical protein
LTKNFSFSILISNLFQIIDHKMGYLIIYYSILDYFKNLILKTFLDFIPITIYKEPYLISSSLSNDSAEKTWHKS